jgi:hypothetical protein
MFAIKMVAATGTGHRRQSFTCLFRHSPLRSLYIVVAHCVCMCAIAKYVGRCLSYSVVELFLKGNENDKEDEKGQRSDSVCLSACLPAVLQSTVY